MTVIAYRDGVMAGDSCWSDADTQGGLIINSQNKLAVLRSGALYGGSGASDDRSLVNRLQDIVDYRQLPSAKDLIAMEHGCVKALLVLPDRSVWVVGTGEGEGGVEPVQLPYFAIGTGGQIAMGALACDKTAVEAVKIACDLNVYCRPPVHSIKLK